MKYVFLLLLLLQSSLVFSFGVKELDKLYRSEASSSKFFSELEMKALELSNKAVPVLVKVMKKDVYPEKNRWHATFTLARIMGDKSLPFIKKFLHHPHWMMRLASLKVLRLFKKENITKEVEERLYDKSMFIRLEALDIIGDRKWKGSASAVWKMLHDKKNYHKVKKGKIEKTEVIKAVIKTLGRLEYPTTKKSLVRLLEDKNFKDLTTEIDQSLQKITGLRSPSVLSQKKQFWSSQRF